MDEATVIYKEKPELNNPILIEGLPGVGNVGKLAAEHLIDEIGAKKFAEIYSTDFPPQVFIDNDGIIHLVKNELYYWKGEVDLIILTGDYQGLSTRGQYILTQKILDIVDGYGTKMIYTLGGYGVGIDVEKPRVTGAATHKTLAKKLKKYDILFKDEGGGGIVGASGLLLGIGVMRGMKGVCLMGETSGYMVDPNSAREVLKRLTKILGIKISFSKLEEKAEEIRRITKHIKSLEKSEMEREGGEDLSYIG
ncbi:MAG: proteasome assembly chaperone family protein [Thermoplasmata archaeon]|nr:MAG: proteasome assembly chaperone family protein [Thermoplasmata archaeon]RLF62432.1 MAG: proteasome assembly chaperone family protein [Thermoplasmata archaeon]